MLTSILSCSEKAYEDAKKLMPGGVNSPVRAAKALEMTPLVVKSAKGCFITDLDERSYLDFCLSWGALILGHAEESISDAVCDQIKHGSSYGALSEIEIKLASLLVEKMPHIEKLRFVSSGTEATMSALRLARGFTGRKKIVKFAGNYHGHHDALLAESGSFLLEAGMPCSLGVNPEFVKDTLVIHYNDPKAIEKLTPQAQDIAAIIFEPVCGNMGVVLPQETFLRALEAFCAQNKVLLIVDEVMTGFRTNFCGATEDFHIKGDLYCFGKIIGGGLPCAFFGGRKEIMDYLAPEGGVFQAGTLSGNPLAMASGLAVTKKMLEDDFYSRLQKKADLLLDPIQAYIHDHKLDVTLNRYGSMFTLFLGPHKVDSFQDLRYLDQKRFNRFYKALFHEGIFLSPSAYEANFISLAHDDEYLKWASKKIIHALQEA